MMNGLPWYKRDPLAFIEGCKGMPLDEVGGYAMLLDLMYLLGRPLTDSYAATGMAICNSAKLWTRIRKSLIERGKLYVTDAGMLSNHRFDTEIEDQHVSRAKRVRAGKASGAARRNGRANPQANGVSNESETQSKTGLKTAKPLKTKGEAGTHVQQTLEQKEELDSMSEAKAPDIDSSLFANAQSEVSTASQLKAAVDGFNAAGEAVGWQRVKFETLSKDRRQKLLRHLRERGGLAGWMADIAVMQADKFTHGGTVRKAPYENWKFKLDCMFQANFRNQMDDKRAANDGHANENDPLAEERWACAKRRETGRWPGGMDPALISASVRAEFSDLFTQQRGL